MLSKWCGYVYSRNNVWKERMEHISGLLIKVASERIEHETKFITNSLLVNVIWHKSWLMERLK